VKNKNSKAKRHSIPNPPPAAPSRAPRDLKIIFVTLLTGIVAAGLVAMQFHYAQDPTSQLALVNLDKRADMLQEVTDPVQRDRMCIPLSAYGRALDRALPKDARVFVMGIVGKTNGGSMGYYYFLKNYLFPRDVEISLSDVFYHEGWVVGVPCNSTEVLKTNGFDLAIRSVNNQMQLIPLTPKGVPKSK
jgi:hypothetical protein